MKEPIELPDDVVSLDPLTLDVHCIEQPKLSKHWGEKLAKAEDALDRAKAALELTKAEAADEISKSPDTFGLTKTTDAAIKAAVDRHPEVQGMTERYQKRVSEVRTLRVMMGALDDRKRMIEGLIKLHGQQYFSTPTIPIENREGWDIRTKRALRQRKPQE